MDSVCVRATEKAAPSSLDWPLARIITSLGSVGGGATAGVLGSRVQCLPANITLFPRTAHPSAALFFPRRITPWPVCANPNPSTPPTSNCFYSLPSVGSTDHPSACGIPGRGASSAPDISAACVLFPPHTGCTDIIPISRLDIHPPGCQLHLAPSDHFNCPQFPTHVPRGNLFLRLGPGGAPRRDPA